jgi:MOSC domain-containing protein YiiM
MPDSSRDNGRGTLLAIWAKGARGEPMIPRSSGELIAGEGLVGSAPARGKRQVTVLSREAWERAAAEAGQPDVDPALRRANLLVSGIDLRETIGRTLAIGETEILIHGETKPCERMDADALRLRETLADWRGGAFGEVVNGGRIRIGDPVAWAETGGSSG